MPIDLLTESPIPLREAASHRLFCGKARDGNALNFSTIWRWATKGIRGTKLETVRVGATLCTTTDAIERFIGRLSDQPESARTPSQRRRDSEAVERRLAAAGI